MGGAPINTSVRHISAKEVAAYVVACVVLVAAMILLYEFTPWTFATGLGLVFTLLAMASGTLIKRHFRPKAARAAKE